MSRPPIEKIILCRDYADFCDFCREYQHFPNDKRWIRCDSPDDIRGLIITPDTQIVISGGFYRNPLRGEIEEVVKSLRVTTVDSSLQEKPDSIP